MIYVDCPRCKQEESLQYRIGSDGDDYRNWQTAEYEKQDCACDLTADEQEIAQGQADIKARDYDDEPSYFLEDLF